MVAYNLYDTAAKWYSQGSVKKFADIEAGVFHKWSHCLNEFDPKKSNSNTAKICNENTVKYADFIKDLKRRVICVDDVKSMLSNKHKFRVIYTEQDTWLTKDPSFVPSEEVVGAELFVF